MRETLYEKYYRRMYEAVIRMNDYAAVNDFARNQVNYGVAFAYQSLMYDLGHTVDLRIYGKDDYLVTDKIVIDGKEIELR